MERVAEFAEAFAGLGADVRVRAGQIVLGKDVSTTHVYMVLSGTLAVRLFAMDGNEVSIRQLRAGDLFGELAALDGRSRSATVTADTDGTLSVMSQRDFIGFLESSPKASMELLRRLAGQIRGLTERLFELGVLSVAARLHRELRRLALSSASPDAVIEVAPTHQELAYRIGARREAVTRELSRLKRLGILEQTGRRLRIADPSRFGRLIAAASGEPF